MAVVGIMGLLAVGGVPAIRGLKGSGGRKEAVGKILGAMELARNTAVGTGTNVALVFPDDTFAQTNYAYRSMAMVQWNLTNSATPPAMIGSWIYLPEGMAIFPNSLTRLKDTGTNVNVTIPPVRTVGGTFRAIIFRGDGSLLDAESTNGIAIFEGRVSGGAPQLNQANITNFETFTLGRFTGRARGTLGPKP